MKALATLDLLHSLRTLPSAIYLGFLACAGTGFAACFPLETPLRPMGFPLSMPAGRGGSISAWGDNDLGKLNVPENATNVIAIAAGFHHSMALRVDGTVVAWGWNAYGQATVPSGATNVVAIAAGGNHCLALRKDGSVLAWGYNEYSQASVPNRATGVVAIAAGESHSMALRADGSVVAWGLSLDGRTSIPNDAIDVVAITAGQNHSLALRADGSVVGWGNDDYGQSTPPPSATNLVAVAAGYACSLALRSDGTVMGWGWGSFGRLDIPTAATNLMAIAAGANHFLGLRTDGVILAWGDSRFAQTAIPATATNAAAMAAGGLHNLALASPDGYPILILSQPLGQRTWESNVVSLAVCAEGPPIHYQWRKNNQDIPGASSSTLRLGAVRSEDAGVYTVAISNGLGTVVSSEAPLVVLSYGAPAVLADGEVVVQSVTRGRSSILTMVTPLPQGYIFYTLDGSQPGFSSPLYLAPVAVSNTVVVRAMALSLDFSRMVEAPPATVEILPYTAQASSSGGGTAALSPALPYYREGAVLTMTATPDPGWTFMRWEGDAAGTSNPLLLTLNRSVQVRAVFGTPIMTNMLGNGRIQITPSGLASYGSTVELRAVPGPGQRFVAWGNAVSGTANPMLFSVRQPTPTVAALFTEGPPGLPVILAQSSNLVVTAGTGLTLGATASGAEPLRYQWRFNGAAIFGATNATLSIEHATEANAGAYELVVSGPAGTTISDAMQVVVSQFAMRPVLSLWGAPGATFQVDYADDLNNGPWLLLTNGLLNGERRDVIDYSSSNRVRRFYRTTQPEQR